MSLENTKSSSIKKYPKPGLPSLPRMLGMLLLFAAIGLSSCEALFVSIA